MFLEEIHTENAIARLARNETQHCQIRAKDFLNAECGLGQEDFGTAIKILPCEMGSRLSELVAIAGVQCRGRGSRINHKEMFAAKQGDRNAK